MARLSWNLRHVCTKAIDDLVSILERDGRLTLSDEKLENLFKVPLTQVGPTCMYLEFANGIDMTICGDGFRSECEGLPSFVEPFIR